MKECDIFRGGSKHTLTPPTYFQGGSGPPQPPHDLRPWKEALGFTTILSIKDKNIKVYNDV